MFIFVMSVCFLLGSCSNTKKAEETSADGTVLMPTSTVISSTITDIITFDEPLIPDPEGLKYATRMETIKITTENHDPVFMWRHRDYTPYWDYKLTGVEEPHLIPYCIKDGETRPCVIVCPGGAYGYRESEYEGSKVAEFINSNWNMNAVVLEYRVKPADYRASVSDALRSVRFIRYYADEFGSDPDRIVVMGFSAGGHLACMAAEKFDYGKAGDLIDNVSSRPNAAILCYPVVSMSEEWAHEASAQNFFGSYYNDKSLLESFSGEKALREDMPPVFVFHAKQDGAVSYLNSEKLFEAMNEAGLSCELHLYEKGDHGCQLALGWGGDISGWTNDCRLWLKRIGILD